jgi:acetyl-CoA acetyltransferase
LKFHVEVAGVGMTPFTKPGDGVDYVTVGVAAAKDALTDAGIGFGDVDRVYAAYAYGDSGCGQRIAYDLGRTAVPVFNVNNNCATGSTALFLAREAIESGSAQCVLVVGFEQMPSGAIVAHYNDRPFAMEWTGSKMREIQGYDPALPGAVQFFGGAGREYAQRHGTEPRTFAMLTVKARRHARDNPRAVFREQVNVDAVLASPMIFAPLTRLQCCPPTTGAAAAILMSSEFARSRGISGACRIVAQAMCSDAETTFEGASMMNVVGFDMTRRAARQVYEQAAIGPEDIDVVELHDCFTANELITYEGLDLVPEGGAEAFILDGENSYGGRIVTNPSGGLLAKGHPIGATGVAQCFELVTQLRGKAGSRQVEGTRFALQHNIAPGTACVVTLYTLA